MEENVVYCTFWQFFWHNLYIFHEFSFDLIIFNILNDVNNETKSLNRTNIFNELSLLYNLNILK